MEQSTNAATETKRTDATSTAPGAALAVAEETARQLAEASLSTNTRRAYLGALGRLETWLASRELEDGAIAAYLGELFEQGRSPATAALVVAALRLRARVTGIPSPVGPATEAPPPSGSWADSGAWARTEAVDRLRGYAGSLRPWTGCGDTLGVCRRGRRGECQRRGRSLGTAGRSALGRYV